MGLEIYPKRGEIYLVCLDPTIGSEINKTRPALIISNNINNELANSVTVVPITSFKREKLYPFEVLISNSGSGLDLKSLIKCNQIRTVDKNRIIKKLGTVSSQKIAEINTALKIHLGID